MKQASLFESDLPLVVFRWRDTEERVEVRWPDLDLLATFQDWPVALDMVLYTLNPKLQLHEVSVRVRR